MSRRLLIGVFDREADLLQATEAALKQGYPILDALTPYPVHGLDRAMGLAPSRLSRACLACGLLGVLVAFWLQFWTSAVSWPLNVGGRPWNSWPAFVPVAFELMVLLAGFGVVIAFFIISRLYPGKKAALPFLDPSGSQFVLLLGADQGGLDPGMGRRLLEAFHAVKIDEREESSGPALEEPVARGAKARGNTILAILLAVLVVLNWTLSADPSWPNLEFLPDMAHSVSFDAYAPNPDLPGQQTLQPPAPGTIPRGYLPLHFKATPEDAVRAGMELHNPFDPKKPGVLQRGAAIFSNYCAVCHGPSGMGDGPVAQRSILKARSLVEGTAIQMKDGQMFHVLTYGQAPMPPYAGLLSQEDRWQVILHVRILQKQARGKGP